MASHFLSTQFFPQCTQMLSVHHMSRTCALPCAFISRFIHGNSNIIYTNYFSPLDRAFSLHALPVWVGFCLLLSFFVVALFFWLGVCLCVLHTPRCVDTCTCEGRWKEQKLRASNGLSTKSVPVQEHADPDRLTYSFTKPPLVTVLTLKKQLINRGPERAPEELRDEESSQKALGCGRKVGG